MAEFGVILGPKAKGNYYGETVINGARVGLVDEGEQNVFESLTINGDIPDREYRIPDRLDAALATYSGVSLKQTVDDFVKNITSLEMSGSTSVQTYEARNSIFREIYQARGQALRNEMLIRLDQPLSRDIKKATSPLENGLLAGPSPITNIIHALEFLKGRSLD